jgi:hypothetical protein
VYLSFQVPFNELSLTQRGKGRKDCGRKDCGCEENENFHARMFAAFWSFLPGQGFCAKTGVAA